MNPARARWLAIAIAAVGFACLSAAIVLLAVRTGDAPSDDPGDTGATKATAGPRATAATTARATTAPATAASARLAPRGDPACLRSPLCELRGACRLTDAGACIAMSDDDCAVACRKAGLCHAVGGQCLAESDDDCAPSENCRNSGRCGAHDGGCSPSSDEHCRASTNCLKRGLCSIERIPDEPANCVARGDDCLRASHCQAQPCVLREGACKSIL